MYSGQPDGHDVVDAGNCVFVPELLEQAVSQNNSHHRQTVK